MISPSASARHRERRPETWTTVEEHADLPGLLTSIEGTVLVESTGTWVAAQPDLVADVEGLGAAARTRSGDTVFVAEEVGLAVHAPTEIGRRFVDAVGKCNRQPRRRRRPGAARRRRSHPRAR